MWGERIRTKLVASGTFIALGLFVVQSVVYASSTRAPSPSETALAPSTTLVSSSAGTAVTVAATTTSTTATTAATTTSLAPKRVESTVQTEPTTTIGTAVQGVVLARTGLNTIPLLVGGVMLILLGAAIALGARGDSNSRRRPSRKRAGATAIRSTVVR